MQLNDEKFQENEINSNFNMDLTSNKLVTPLLASTADMDTCNFTTISEKKSTPNAETMLDDVVRSDGVKLLVFDHSTESGKNPDDVINESLSQSCHGKRSNTCENCGQVVRCCETDLNKVCEGENLMKISTSGVSIASSSVVDFCRICHCEADSDLGRLIAPCKCRGTLRNVHQACLQQWIKSSDCKHCELCGFHFAMDTKLKPLSKWEKLSMSTSERRKILCSVIFHLVAITCVIWSLYVLIERTADELQSNQLHWPFWTKLVVVAIGFVGGMVFMYVQCKIYVQLWRRLKSFNRIIYVQHQPTTSSSEGERLATTTRESSEARILASQKPVNSSGPRLNDREEGVVLVEMLPSV